MKKETKWTTAIILICSMCFINSCSNDDFVEEISNETAKTHKISPEKAAGNVMDFVSKVDNATRSASRRIANIKVISMPEAATRSNGGSPITLDSLFYVVNFANNEGFALAAIDERDTPIYAYIEEGNYSGDGNTENPGFDAFMNALIENLICQRYYDGEEGGGWNNDGDHEIVDEDADFPFLLEDEGSSGNNRPNKFEVMSPLLVTKWGQMKYNYYCPSSTQTGCVPTAIAQICSYLRRPNYVSWSYNGTGGQSPIDWEEIVSDCENNGGNSLNPNLKNQIAHLMRFLGVDFEADYSSDGTSVNSEDAINTMRNRGYNVSGLTDYDAADVVNDLRAGNRIIFMRGYDDYYHTWFFFRNYTGGHAWVVDGYIDQVVNYERSIYIHCNWGWDGSQNGYFLSNVLNAYAGPVYNDDITTRATYNYRYKLKTATFIK